MSPSKSDKDEQMEYQAKDDLHTLTCAMEIKNDKPRLKRAMAMAKKQMKNLEDVSNA